MPENKELALMSDLEKVYGCGALNWDIFFEVRSLELLREIPGVELEVRAGGEVVLDRQTFLRVLSHLEGLARSPFSCGGGSSANTIFALARLGLNCGFVGACGEDEFGDLVLSELAHAGVDLSLVVRGGTTSLAIIVLDPERDRFIIVSPGSAEAILAEEAYLKGVAERLKGERALFHLSSFASKEGQTFQKDLLLYLSPKARKDLFVSFDPGEIYAKKGKEFLLPYLRAVDLLFITEGELSASSLLPSEILDLSVLALFVKRGKHGARCLTKGFLTEVPAPTVPAPVDNTGAGDYFNAGVLAGLMDRKDLASALSLGVKLAVESLKDYGRKAILFLNGQFQLK